MVYQDHLTKFFQLQPLKTKTAEEVAYHLLQIFLTFGAPAILQSDNGSKFCNQVISKLYAMWKDVKIVHGKPHHSQTQGSVERANQEIQNMLTAWMNDNDTNKRSDGLPFVQFAKNTTYHEGICQSPYETKFGVKPKRGIASSSLPGKQIANIETKEQLEEIVDTFEENLSSGHNEYHIPKKNIEQELQPTTSSYQALTEQHKFISIKRAASKDNLLLQATKMLRTSKRKFLLKLVILYEYKSLMSTVAVQMPKMCWRLLLE
ncbi:KRAB-A domain-containing protein 2-like [Centruroides vittatus]|uniref:KRAB-A domain-containing protein 2-like n=1 Tax=Centruroides vittatus TaxID=120091 RepID=UPI00351091C0